MKALILDFGGPVLQTPFERLPAMEDRLGVSRGTFEWTGPFDPVADGLWRSMQDGGISERDYWNMRCAELRPYLSPNGTSDLQQVMKLLFTGFDESELVRPQWRPLMRAAADAGIRVVVLTNDLELFHGPGWAQAMPILTEMDAVVDASRLEHRKPHPAAYHAALEAAGVAAEDALMVDDQPGNVEGARAVGMHAVLFDVTDTDASFAEIQTLLDLD